MDIKEYEEFCKNSKYGNFMQSADWAKVKKGWLNSDKELIYLSTVS